MVKVYFDGSTTRTANVLVGKRLYSIQLLELPKKMTGNEGEYHALIHALERAVDRKLKNITVLGDSELVIRQMNGVYKVKNARLKPLYEYAKALACRFSKISFEHVYRKDNLAGHLLD